MIGLFHFKWTCSNQKSKIICNETFLGKGCNLPMGQLSQGWPSDLVIQWYESPTKVSQLTISRQQWRPLYFNCTHPSILIKLHFTERGTIEWMKSSCSHPLLYPSFQYSNSLCNNHLCRSLWPMASIFSTGILCIFFFASLCSSIPFLAPATSSAKSLWFRSSL